jgi:hypothetical protein
MADENEETTQRIAVALGVHRVFTQPRSIANINHDRFRPILLKKSPGNIEIISLLP